VTTTSEEKMLYLLKSRGGQTAAEAGKALGITTPGAQQQLARLAAKGLARARDRKQPRGRPRRHWTLTEAGHARFPDRHADLTLDLLRATKEVFGAAGLERLISHREAQTLAHYRGELDPLETLEARVAGLAALRSREGYMAQWERQADGSFLLVENHCPVCAAASFCQGLCRSELEIFRAVLGPRARVVRTDHILSGARRCAYRISSGG